MFFSKLKHVFCVAFEYFLLPGSIPVACHNNTILTVVNVRAFKKSDYINTLACGNARS